MPDPEPSAERSVAEQVAALIPDRATVQLGIGTLPAAVARALSGHRDCAAASVSDAGRSRRAGCGHQRAQGPRSGAYRHGRPERGATRLRGAKRYGGHAERRLHAQPRRHVRLGLVPTRRSKSTCRAKPTRSGPVGAISARSAAISCEAARRRAATVGVPLHDAGREALTDRRVAARPSRYDGAQRRRRDRDGAWRRAPARVLVRERARRLIAIAHPTIASRCSALCTRAAAGSENRRARRCMNHGFHHRRSRPVSKEVSLEAVGNDVFEIRLRGPSPMNALGCRHLFRTGAGGVRGCPQARAGAAVARQRSGVLRPRRARSARAWSCATRLAPADATMRIAIDAVAGCLRLDFHFQQLGARRAARSPLGPQPRFPAPGVHRPRPRRRYSSSPEAENIATAAPHRREPGAAHDADGEPVTSEYALGIELVNEVVAPEELEARTRAFATTLAGRPRPPSRPSSGLGLRGHRAATRGGVSESSARPGDPRVEGSCRRTGRVPPNTSRAFSWRWCNERCRAASIG